MPLNTAVIQYAPTTNTTQNLTTINTLVTKAANQGAELAVLPEYATFTSPHLDQTFVENAQPLDGPSVTALEHLSKTANIAIIAGVNEPAGDNRIYNTLVGIQHGELKTIYRKLHLYDAFGTQESTWVTAGDIQQPQLLEINGLKIGLQTCYDLRFPEVSRTLINAGADILALPAEWVPGPLKESHWTTLLKARAIENTCYIGAAGQTAPTGIGHSTIIDPMGIPLAMLGEEPGIATAEITQNRIHNVRTTNPALAARRFSIQPKEYKPPLA